MKKILSIVILFITFIILYFLQINFFSWFNIAGIKPNLFIIFVLFIGLFLGKAYGISAGVIFGLLIDFFISKSIGINAILLGLAGFLRRSIYKEFFKR